MSYGGRAPSCFGDRRFIEQLPVLHLLRRVAYRDHSGSFGQQFASPLRRPRSSSSARATPSRLPSRASGMSASSFNPSVSDWGSEEGEGGEERGVEGRHGDLLSPGPTPTSRASTHSQETPGSDGRAHAHDDDFSIEDPVVLRDAEAKEDGPGGEDASLRVASAVRTRRLSWQELVDNGIVKEQGAVAVARGERHQQKTELNALIDLFNHNPQKGIEELTSRGIVQNTPSDIASFLYRTGRLSRRAVGLFLARRSLPSPAPHHGQEGAGKSGKAPPPAPPAAHSQQGDSLRDSVLSFYAQSFDFANLGFVDALRVFLKGFSLVGEAQVVDRTMEAFAARYVACNPGKPACDHKDTAYVLAFSVMLLNTDLHNKNLSGKFKKMTLEQFARNNRGICKDGSSLPDEFLQSVYVDIASKPLRVAQNDGNVSVFSDPNVQGWLHKLGGRIKTKHARWCLLKDSCLFYFKSPDDEKPQGIVQLENVTVREAPHRGRFAFELLPVGGAGTVKSNKVEGGVVVSGAHESFVFQASSEHDMRRWVANLRGAIFMTPVAQRRETRAGRDKVGKGREEGDSEKTK